MKVRLSVDEHKNLVAKFGEAKTLEYIDKIDMHMASEGKEYANHYATIVKWITADEKKNATSQPEQPQKKNRFCNFTQRKNDYAEIERLEMEHLKKLLNHEKS